MKPDTQNTAAARPNIADYVDYRAYLRDMFVYNKAVDPRYSYRVFSRRAGFSSPNYLKLVADGQRNLARESVEKFARGLGLTKPELRVFRAMVLLADARSDEERNRYVDRLHALSKGHDASRLRADQFAVYDDWYPLVVWEMAHLPDFKPDPAWIARRLQPRVTAGQARRTVELLMRLGLLERDDDSLTPTDRNISTGPDVAALSGLAVRNFHRAHLTLAAESLDQVARDKRNITSLTVRLSREGYAQAVKEIAGLRARLLELADASAADGSVDQDVHQVMFALYPVTQRPAKSKVIELGDRE